MAKCPNCGGTGSIANGMWLCCECQGTGFIEDEKPSPLPMTNEEYLRSLNTEQLAEAIYYLTWFHTELDERLDKNVKNGRYNDDENIKIVVDWLKQPNVFE